MDVEKAELQDYLEVLGMEKEAPPWFYDNLYLMKIRDMCIQCDRFYDPVIERS